MNFVEYNDKKILYEIVRAKIKNMYIYIKEGKVIVKVPLRLKEKYIVDFVNKKAKWIYNKVNESQKQEKINKTISKEEVKKLENIIKDSVKEYADKLNLYPNKVRIRDITYAWGSCSTNKNITINKQLAIKEEDVIKYVVLHEMCHLKYMNHSKDFWDLVESIMPEYKTYKKSLKQ